MEFNERIKYLKDHGFKHQNSEWSAVYYVNTDFEFVASVDEHTLQNESDESFMQLFEDIKTRKKQLGFTIH